MAFGRGRRSGPCSYLSALTFALAFLLSVPAFAQRELLTKPGQKGQVIIDQISGFRGGVSGIVGGQNELAPSLQYYGPIGFALQRYSQVDAQFTQNVDTVTATTFWLAPSADFFVINHLSIGGMFEIAYTSNSGSEPTGNARSINVPLPSNTSFSILPRVGWMFALGDRWAVWPRFALGYVSNAISSTPTGPGNRSVGGSSVYGLGLDLDTGILFRVNETFFVRLAPEIGWIPSGGNSTTNGGRTITTTANYLEFTLTGGIGVMFEL